MKKNPTIHAERCPNTVDLELRRTDAELKPFDEREQLSVFGAHQALVSFRPSVTVIVGLERLEASSVILQDGADMRVSMRGGQAFAILITGEVEILESTAEHVDEILSNKNKQSEEK